MDERCGVHDQHALAAGLVHIDVAAEGELDDVESVRNAVVFIGGPDVNFSGRVGREGVSIGIAQGDGRGKALVRIYADTAGVDRGTARCGVGGKCVAFQADARGKADQHECKKLQYAFIHDRSSFVFRYLLF